MASKIYFSDALNKLYRVNPGSSTLDATEIGTLPVFMSDMALSASGQLYGISFGAIYKINKTTAQAILVSSHDLFGANALFIAPNGTAYAASFGSNGIYKINLANGHAEKLPLSASNYFSAGDITMLNGELVVATSDSKLVRVDAQTGATLGSVDHGIANLFGIVTVGNTLYGVADGSLYKLNAVTGTSTLVADYDVQSMAGAAVSDFGQSGIVMYGTSGDNSLTGSIKDDVLLGAAGDDRLSGGKGRDQLIGGEGEDTLIGGAGGDNLQGGLSNDTFVFTKAADSFGSTSNRDTIADFRRGDEINLKAIDAVSASAVNETFTLDRDGIVKAGEIKISYSGGNTFVAANVDADVALEFSLLIKSAHVSAGDFVL
jgi:Ca2+-binding RTX toxin-like protein